ncbi:MAG: hypothetical protein LBD75_01185 [Candidatus Peribacteria bacterium]|jgi:UDP-N-acetylmuramate dehydrogenase|nr:hypothetical protein [Candidatus Peribacteria bacterium]
MEVGNRVAWVEGYDMQTGEKRNYSHEECQFGYRRSIFKSALRNQFLITAVVFQLERFDASYAFVTDYPDVQAALQGKQPASLTELSELIVEIRAKKLPDVKKV